MILILPAQSFTLGYKSGCSIWCDLSLYTPYHLPVHHMNRSSWLPSAPKKARLTGRYNYRTEHYHPWHAWFDPYLFQPRPALHEHPKQPSLTMKTTCAHFVWVIRLAPVKFCKWSCPWSEMPIKPPILSWFFQIWSIQLLFVCIGKNELLDQSLTQTNGLAPKFKARWVKILRGTWFF